MFKQHNGFDLKFSSINSNFIYIIALFFIMESDTIQIYRSLKIKIQDINDIIQY